MVRRALTFGLAIAITSAVASMTEGTAAAQVSDVLVLGIRSLEGDDALARQITQALDAHIADVPRWKAGRREVSLAQMMLVYGCDDPDASCLSRIANGLRVDELIYGTLHRTGVGKQYDFGLSLAVFDRKTGQIEHALTTELDHDRAGEQVAARAAQWTARLAGQPATGQLRVTVNVPGATVQVDGKPVGTADAETGIVQTELPAGQHQVQVSAEGYGTFRGTVSVAADEESAVEVELVERAGGPLGAPSTGIPKERVVYKTVSRSRITWPTYVALGGTALFTGLTVYAFVRAGNLRDEPAYTNYVAMFGSSAAACSNAATGSMSLDPAALAANDICKKLDRIDPWRWVFFSLTLAAAGTSSYFLFRDLKSRGEGSGTAAGSTASERVWIGGSIDRHGALVTGRWMF